MMDKGDRERRGGTISLSGVYGGSADPADDGSVDKQIQLRMGREREALGAGHRALLEDDTDPLGVEDLATTSCRSSRRPTPTRFPAKQDGAIKILLQP